MSENNWSSVGFKIGAFIWGPFFLIFFFQVFFFFCQQGNTRYIVYAGTKFPIYKVWWLREASQIRHTFIPFYVKMSFKAQHGRIPIDPAVLAGIGHRFLAKKKELKILMRGSEATRAETRNRRLFWGALENNFSLENVGWSPWDLNKADVGFYVL